MLRLFTLPILLFTIFAAGVIGIDEKAVQQSVNEDASSSLVSSTIIRYFKTNFFL